MSDTNEHEERRRAAKAYALVRWLETAGYSADDAEAFLLGDWEAAADRANVNPPSDRTKAIVLHILRERADG